MFANMQFLNPFGNYMRTQNKLVEFFCLPIIPGLRHSTLLPIGFNYLNSSMYSVEMRP